MREVTKAYVYGDININSMYMVILILIAYDQDRSHGRLILRGFTVYAYIEALQKEKLYRLLL